jgi:hypothetical protein
MLLAASLSLRLAKSPITLISAHFYINFMNAFQDIQPSRVFQPSHCGTVTSRAEGALMKILRKAMHILAYSICRCTSLPPPSPQSFNLTVSPPSRWACREIHPKRCAVKSPNQVTVAKSEDQSAPSKDRGVTRTESAVSLTRGHWSIGYSGSPRTRIVVSKTPTAKGGNEYTVLYEGQELPQDYPSARDILWNLEDIERLDGFIPNG